MTIKAYPLHFTDEKLKEIADKAKSQGKSIKQFIHDLIDNELRGESNEVN